MIPLSVPNISGNEWKYVKDCLDTGWISSAGGYVTQFENMVAEFAGSKYGIACVNGTAGLHLAQVLLGIGKGDAILVPNITFIATLNAIKYTGATPILIDVDEDTWQMDVGLIREFMHVETEEKSGYRVLRNKDLKVKGIMPVHVLGNMVDMDTLLDVAQEFNLKIIEDSTEALGSYYNGKHSGTFGEIGVFSFNGNKIISSGGGGVIVTDNDDIAQRAKHLTTQAKVSSDEYIHDQIGYNYRLVNILSAIGVAQMEQLPSFVKRKKEINDFYRNNFKGVGDISFQKMNDEVDSNCWLFTMRTNKMRHLLKSLNNDGVQCRPFWMPMNQLPMFKNDIYFQKEDKSNNIYQSSISLPCSTNITNEQLEEVARKVKKHIA